MRVKANLAVCTTPRYPAQSAHRRVWLCRFKMFSNKNNSLKWKQFRCFNLTSMEWMWFWVIYKLLGFWPLATRSLFNNLRAWTHYTWQLVCILCMTSSSRVFTALSTPSPIRTGQYLASCLFTVSLAIQNCYQQTNFENSVLDQSAPNLSKLRSPITALLLLMFLITSLLQLMSLNTSLLQLMSLITSLYCWWCLWLLPCCCWCFWLLLCCSWCLWLLLFCSWCLWLLPYCWWCLWLLPCCCLCFWLLLCCSWCLWLLPCCRWCLWVLPCFCLCLWLLPCCCWCFWLLPCYC